MTYTPRLIVVDLKDALNNLRQCGTLYDLDSENDSISWCVRG